REVRAGRIALREPETACGRAALRVRLANILLVTSTKPANPVAIDERAYGKTVWSWPSLLRSSSCGGVSEPNRVDFRRQFAGRGRPERTRLPGERGISRQTTAQGRPGV